MTDIITMPYYQYEEIPRSATINLCEDYVPNTLKVFLCKNDLVREITNCYIVTKNEVSFPTEMSGLKVLLKYDVTGEDLKKNLTADQARIQEMLSFIRMNY